MQQLLKRHDEEMRNNQFCAVLRIMPYIIIRHNFQWRKVCQNIRGAKLLLISTGFCQTKLFKPPFEGVKKGGCKSEILA